MNLQGKILAILVSSDLGRECGAGLVRAVIDETVGCSARG